MIKTYALKVFWIIAFFLSSMLLLWSVMGVIVQSSWFYHKEVVWNVGQVSLYLVDALCAIVSPLLIYRLIVQKLGVLVIFDILGQLVLVQIVLTIGFGSLARDNLPRLFIFSAPPVMVVILFVLVGWNIFVLRKQREMDKKNVST